MSEIDFRNMDYQKKVRMEHYAQFAVLLLLVDYEGEKHLLFELRSKLLDDRAQPGDVSFPGGFCESDDIVKEALRETYEEVGILPEEIEVLGTMEPMVAGSKRVITPVVGYMPTFSFDKLKLNIYEVEEVFLVPLSYFMENEPEIHYVDYTPAFYDDFPFDKIANGRDYRWTKRTDEVKFYFYKQYNIWGFTATMTHGFIQILRENLKEEER